MTGERPCHPSEAWGREFESLVRYVRSSIDTASVSHARGIAGWLARLSGHDGDALFRCALADVGRLIEWSPVR
jgi:hypothetical protein